MTRAAPATTRAAGPTVSDRIPSTVQPPLDFEPDEEEPEELLVPEELPLAEASVEEGPPSGARQSMQSYIVVPIAPSAPGPTRLQLEFMQTPPASKTTGDDGFGALSHD